jgi:sugar/nucleoside kinase (ribokinase family)
LPLHRVPHRASSHAGPPALAEELTDGVIAALLRDAALVVFDGRLAECALRLAAGAAAAGVPCLVEAERLRPGLDALLQFADVVVTSTGFPSAWTGHARAGDALVEAAARLPRARLLVTTLGARGCVALDRGGGGGGGGEEASVEGVLAGLMAAAQPVQAPPAGEAALPLPRDTLASPHLRLVRPPQPPPAAVAAAAAAAAAANADAANAARYAPSAADAATTHVHARVLYTPAAATSRVVDTTGAGDAFIGALCYGVVASMRPENALRLASWVAAAKCRQLGPRPGLPRREEVPPHLLEP